MNKQTTIERFPAFTRKVTAEGIVLLKNNNQVLPLLKTDTVSIFGRCQIDFYRSGTGSGGAVNVPYSVNALDGLKNTDIALNQELIEVYETFVKENPYNGGDGSWASEPWHQKELTLTEEIVSQASSKSNKAIIFLGRTAGEDKDHHTGEGSFKLTKDEFKMLDLVTKHFDKVALIYNVGNIIDMSYIGNYGDKIDSILYTWQGGMEGGNALADILTAKVTPSGKLPDTIAKNLEDYPSYKNFGNNLENYYEEDIYVGYRYFETFNKDAVLYPFGHGLSYTTFELNCVNTTQNETSINVDIEVKNIGKYTGKEVVQIYVESPQGKLGKPFIELKAFDKTNHLDPNESQILQLEIPLKQLASYDDGGYTGYKSAYVIEPGDYNVYFGNSSRNLKYGTLVHIDEIIITEQLEEAIAPLKDFKRMKPGTKKPNGEYEITFENVPKRTIDLNQRIITNLPLSYPVSKNQDIKLVDVYNGTGSLKDFISQLSVEDMSLIVLGEGMSHPLVTPGTAAAFGGLYPSISKYGIPAACAADGPSGLRMDTGDKATQMPIGTMVASTWNTKLVEEMYQLEGEELALNQVDTLLGPGMNIHRHPLCGRNFEYFSEDPLLSGKMAAANAVGLDKGGSAATLKHYAANDQEFARNDIDAIASERCLREIHLKGFEIAVKESPVRSIMTAYNPVNGHQAASNYDLNTQILRNEWGFKGLVMTDWWARMNHNSTPDKSEKFRVAEMIRSQNDLYMVIPNHGAASSEHRQQIINYIKTGELTIGELQRCVYNILNFILKAPVIKRPLKQLDILEISSSEDNPEDVALSNKVNFYSRKDAKSWINLESDGIYEVVVQMRSKLNELAQSACNILINNQRISNVQLNGNDNQLVTKTLQKIKINKGIQTVSLEFTKPGLEIVSVSFVKVENNE